jgi:hypothetical protein
MRGVIPPGGIVPLHSHDDAEAFLVLSGTKRALLQGDAGPEWHRVRAGDDINVESGTPHAWRNDSDQPVVDLLITTNRLGQFFDEMRQPAGASGPPTPDDLARLAALAEKYGYWFATPEENAAAGIQLPTPATAEGSVQRHPRPPKRRESRGCDAQASADPDRRAQGAMGLRPPGASHPRRRRASASRHEQEPSSAHQRSQPPG